MSKSIMTRWILPALAGGALAGCNLLLNVGEHHVVDMHDGGVDGSEGGGGAGGLDAGNDSGSVGGGGSGGEDAGCPATLTEPKVETSGQHRPAAIHVDAASVYWINESDPAQFGQIMTLDRTTGETKELVGDLGNPVALSAGSTNVYFTDDLNDLGKAPGVYRMNKSGGGAPLKVFGSSGVGAGALDLEFPDLYTEAWSPSDPVRLRYTFVGNTSFNGCDLYVGGAEAVGGRITAIGTFTDPPDGGGDATTHVYFAVKTGTTGTIREVTVAKTNACQAPQDEGVFAQNQPDVSTLLVTSTHVVWLTADAFLRQDRATPLSAPEVVVKNLMGPTSLDLYGGLFYFTDSGRGILGAAKFGTPKKIVACGQSDPRGLRVHPGTATAFWTNRGSGEIMSLGVP